MKVYICWTTIQNYYVSGYLGNLRFGVLTSKGIYMFSGVTWCITYYVLLLFYPLGAVVSL